MNEERISVLANFIVALNSEINTLNAYNMAFNEVNRMQFKYQLDATKISRTFLDPIKSCAVNIDDLADCLKDAMAENDQNEGGINGNE